MKTTKKKVSRAKRQQQQQPTQPVAPPAPAIPAPISATLSPQTSELVRWYCAITHHHEAAAIEGAVHGGLERAKEDYESPGGGDGFDWLLEDVLATKFRDDERSPRGPWLDYRTVGIDPEAAALLRRYQHETGQDLRDIVSGALMHVLIMAFDPEVPDGRYRAEDGWLCLQEKVQEAAQRRLGLGEEAA